MRPGRPRREASEEIIQRIENPFVKRDDSERSNEISPNAQETIDYNDHQLWQLARYAALQAMPFHLARGVKTDVEQESTRLNRFIRKLVAEVLDTDSTWLEDRLDLYNVRIGVAFHRGEEFTTKNKNRVQLEVEVFLSLESTNLHIAPKNYQKVERIADQLVEGE